MSYRMIALDLDGTLLTSRKQILPESLAALDLARKAGLEVMIVTGRHHIAIHPFYQALNLNTPAICCNGTYLYDYQARSVLASNPLTAAQAHQVLKRLNDADIHGLMYVDDAMLYQQTSGHVIRSHAWRNLYQRINVQLCFRLKASSKPQTMLKLSGSSLPPIPILPNCALSLTASNRIWDSPVNGLGTIRSTLRKRATAKGNRLAEYSPHAVLICLKSSPLAIILTTSAC